jgi:hypothetical protein
VAALQVDSDCCMAERLQGVLLLNDGRLAYDVSAILRFHPRPLKRWIRLFATAGVEAHCTFNCVGNTPWLTDTQIQQFTPIHSADVL